MSLILPSWKHDSSPSCHQVSRWNHLDFHHESDSHQHQRRKTVMGRQWSIEEFSLSDIFFVLEMIALLQCLFFPSILISQFNLFLLLLKDLISFFNFFKWFNLSFIFLKVSKGWVWFHYKSKFMCCVKKFDSIFFRIFLFI